MTLLSSNDSTVIPIMSVSGSDYAETEYITDLEILEEEETETNESVEIIGMDSLNSELVGVNEKLTVILAVIICAIVWKMLTAVYKLFDMFF